MDIHKKGADSSLRIIYYLSAFTMLPDLDASFVLNYLQNPTPDDKVRITLDVLLHDDDTPLLNIDPEQTLDPTPNDPLTSTVPSPINSQSSHASCPNKVVPYKNNRGSTTLHYDDLHSPAINKSGKIESRQKLI